MIGVVATNANFNKEETTKVARMAMNGIARSVRPANTMLDGDTIFSLATGKKKADVNIVGAFAAKMVSEAILNSVQKAVPTAGLPSASDK